MPDKARLDVEMIDVEAWKPTPKSEPVPEPVEGEGEEAAAAPEEPAEGE